MDLGLKGKIALVTGGERGIGREACLALAREGVNVASCDIAPNDGAGCTRAEIERLGVRGLAAQVDVSREEQVATFVERVERGLGPIDILVSNAGTIEWEPVTKITLECWNRIIAVNLTGAMLFTREVARRMVPRHSGVILYTSSTIRFNPAYKEAAYRVSKTGVQVFAETAAIELAPCGIRVNLVAPGLVNSPSWARGVLEKAASDPETGPGLMASIPLGRLGLPRDIGSAFAFLASERCSFANGATIVLDGGFSLRPLTLIGRDEIARMNL
jgi:NAD(P)-dependent dehydrogenase (short-subunit alcohol dehydrogenase family)